MYSRLSLDHVFGLSDAGRARCFQAEDDGLAQEKLDEEECGSEGHVDGDGEQSGMSQEELELDDTS